MKKMNLFLSFTAFLIFVFSSCDKVNEITVEMSTEEAVESIEQCLANSTGGYAEFVEQLAAVYALTMDSCNITGDTTINASTTVGVTTYSYASAFNYNLSCTAGLPSSLSGTLASTGSFSAPRVSSTDQGGGTSTLGNLSPSQTEYDVDGVYTRNGTVVSKIAQKGTFTYNLAMTATNVMVNKTSKLITGGSATFTFAGVSKGLGSNSFNFMGTITFDGANNATIVMQGVNHSITIN